MRKSSAKVGVGEKLRGRKPLEYRRFEEFLNEVFLSRRCQVFSVNAVLRVLLLSLEFANFDVTVVRRSEALRRVACGALRA